MHPVHRAFPAVIFLVFACRAVCGFEFEFDYRYDEAGFFDAPQRREALETAGRLMNRYVDPLDAIVPEDGNTWSLLLSPPGGQPFGLVSDLTVQQDKLLVFVAGRPLDVLAQSLDAEPFGTGTDAWLETIKARGQAGATTSPATDYGPWGSTVSFDSEDVPWYFGLEIDGIQSHEFDFITVAMHELMHVMGFGGARSFRDQIRDNRFTGVNAVRAGSSTNPTLELDSGKNHFRRDTKSRWMNRSQEALIAPAIAPNQRQYPTRLDRAALVDIGWTEASAGDADRNGRFDTADLIRVFQQGLYETGRVASWSDGDWNDDALFDTADLTAAFQAGTFEQPAALSLALVPEPAFGVCGWVGVLVAWSCCRRQRVVRCQSAPSYV